MFWGSVAHEPIIPLSDIGIVIVVAGLILMNRSAGPKAVPAEACAE
jgi:drug/metabolite transporter (DMT)-like permease